MGTNLTIKNDCTKFLKKNLSYFFYFFDGFYMMRGGLMCAKKCYNLYLVVIMPCKIDIFTIIANELSLALESIQGCLYEWLLLMSKYLVDIDK